MDFIETEQPLTLLLGGISVASFGSKFSTSGVCIVGGMGDWSGGAGVVSFGVFVGEISLDFSGSVRGTSSS